MSIGSEFRTVGPATWKLRQPSYRQIDMPPASNEVDLRPDHIVLEWVPVSSEQGGCVIIVVPTDRPKTKTTEDIYPCDKVDVV